MYYDQSKYMDHIIDNEDDVIRNKPKMIKSLIPDIKKFNAK